MQETNKKHKDLDKNLTFVYTKIKGEEFHFEESWGNIQNGAKGTQEKEKKG